MVSYQFTVLVSVVVHVKLKNGTDAVFPLVGHGFQHVPVLAFVAQPDAVFGDQRNWQVANPFFERAPWVPLMMVT